MAGASSWSSWRRLGFHHRHDDDGPTAKMVALNIRSNEFKFRFYKKFSQQPVLLFHGRHDDMTNPNFEIPHFSLIIIGALNFFPGKTKKF